MKSFKILLDEFDTVLKKKNLSNYNKLGEPLPLKVIDEYFEKLNFHNLDLHLLYEWKNGFDDSISGSCDITDFGPFLSLESIIKGTGLNSEYKLWPECFIPFINDFSGSWLLLNNQLDFVDEQIYLYSPSLLFVEPITYFDSVYSMVETIIEAYNQNIFEYDPVSDFLDYDVPKFRKLGKAINKKSKYWSIENH